MDVLHHVMAMGFFLEMHAMRSSTSDRVEADAQLSEAMRKAFVAH